MKKTFTLIECMVVVAIIAILASFIIPSLNKARETAIRASCASQLSNIGKTITKSYVGNNGYLPAYNWMGGIEMTPTYICPKDPNPKSMEFFIDGYGSSEEYTSYGINLSSTGKNIMKSDVNDLVLFFDSDDLYGNWVNPPKQKSNNGHGNNEGGYDPSNPGKGGPKDGDGSVLEDIELHGSVKGPNWDKDIGGVGPEDVDNWYYGNLDFRHLGTANHLLLDGSVKVISYRMPLYRLIWE